MAVLDGNSISIGLDAAFRVAASVVSAAGRHLHLECLQRDSLTVLPWFVDHRILRNMPTFANYAYSAMDAHIESRAVQKSACMLLRAIGMQSFANKQMLFAGRLEEVCGRARTLCGDDVNLNFLNSRFPSCL